jgi:hypothetical protein
MSFVLCCLWKVEHVCSRLVVFLLVQCFCVCIVVGCVCWVRLRSGFRRLCGGTLGVCGFDVVDVALLVMRFVWFVTLGVRKCSWEQCLALGVRMCRLEVLREHA